MRDFLSLLSIASLGFVLQNCAPVYVPNTINTGMVTQKGDIAGALHISNAIDLHLAWGIDSNLMAFGSYQNFKIEPTTVSWSNGSSTEVGGSRSNMVELGGGYYNRFGQKNRGLIEGFGGFGYGSSSTKEGFGGSYQKYFAQTSLGFVGQHFEALYSLKPAYVSFTNKTEGLSENIPNPVSDLFIENAVTLRFGSPQIKFTTQFGISIGTDQDLSPYEYMPFRLSAGFVVRLNRFNL